ncbi:MULTISPECIES: acyl-CoA carboxylase epsilon subunit [unclassified Streptomyces]|uniref:acyl-CoA carboxylase epsilon subunit n=1 Tax=unclassified Streptomyces TaxID=2593676 RepID=UPI0005A864B0|nr:MULTISPECIES: acyl-CoA carboxylase epsilon subunit [unclassified Streptomyces]MBQ1100512.1 acyl-CoA carboxylase subunit epsilon [Streptomyces sp. b94]
MLTPPPPIRIEKGQATDEELAALAALLLSRATRADVDAQASTPGTTSWRPRPFHPPHSWQTH